LKGKAIWTTYTHAKEHVVKSCLQKDLFYHVREFSSCYMFTECSLDRRECCFCYPSVSIAYATLPSFEVCLLSYYRHIPSMTVSLLVFIPGLMWFFDRYLKLLLLSYMPSANTLLTLLFPEASSTNFFRILPSCTSSLVPPKTRFFSS
jgi:hypothetical protein